MLTYERYGTKPHLGKRTGVQEMELELGLEFTELWGRVSARGNRAVLCFGW